MPQRPRASRLLIAATVAVTLSSIHLAGAPQAARQPSRGNRFLVVARSASDMEALRAEVMSAGGTIASDLSQIGALAVNGSDQIRARMRASAFAAGVASDHIVRLIDPAHASDMFNGSSQQAAGTPQSLAPRRRITADPAFALPGLMWSIERINAPEAWKATLGSAAVKVGVV